MIKLFLLNLINRLRIFIIKTRSDIIIDVQKICYNKSTSPSVFAFAIIINEISIFHIKKSLEKKLTIFVTHTLNYFYDILYQNNESLRSRKIMK